jgi:ligand-binding SRPBCC domain-containing protein
VKIHFSRPLLEYLSPAFPRIEIKKYEGESLGNKIEIEMNLILFSLPFHVQIVEVEEIKSNQYFFVDEGRKLPPFLKYWRHRHELIRDESRGTRIIDHLWAETNPYFPEWLLRKVLESQFGKRGPLYRKFFENKMKELSAL